MKMNKRRSNVKYLVALRSQGNKHEILIFVSELIASRIANSMVGS